MRAYRLLNKYGLTVEAFETMLHEQKSACAICRRVLGRGKNGLHIDHDHASGRVRGLLCRSCNHMLGNAMDDPAILLRAIEYLAVHGVLSAG